MNEVFGWALHFGTGSFSTYMNEFINIAPGDNV